MISTPGCPWTSKAGRRTRTRSRWGSKEKFWVRDAVRAPWLFKFARTSEDGFVSGEAWAEIAASSIAALLGVPTSPVRLPHCDGRRGTLSRSIVPGGWTLVLGNELLSRNNSQYVGGQSTENPGYSVAAVHAELRGMPPPLGWVGPRIWTASMSMSGRATYSSMRGLPGPTDTTRTGVR